MAIHPSPQPVPPLPFNALPRFLPTPYVHVQFSFVGFHCWPEAPDKVAYLRERHRHDFTVRVEMSVAHTDRAVEINLLEAELKELIYEDTPIKGFEVELGSLSCESLAANLGRYLNDKYQPVFIQVLVLEDGKNGGGVFR